MKKLGLIGGIGPSSTISYYKGIIEGCKNRLPDNAYPCFIVENLNMTEMLSYIEKHDMASLLMMLLNCIIGMKNAGATFCAIASNTPHIVYDELSTRSPIPIVSIVETTAEFANSKGYRSVLLIGTKSTTSADFYPDALAKYGIKCVVPSNEDRQIVQDVIFPNLENGVVLEKDRNILITLIKRYLAVYKIDAVILGCTELPMIIGEDNIGLPVIDTVRVHINAIVKEIIND